MKTKTSTSRVQEFRSRLALPENKEEREKYEAKQRESNQKYVDKMLSGSNANDFRKKTNQQARKSKLRKAENESRMQYNDTSNSPFKSKKGLKKAVNRIKKSLPKTKGKAVEAVKVVAEDLDIHIEHKTKGHKIIRERKNLQEVSKVVKDFYETDVISRQMPGKKDTIRTTSDSGSKDVLQKRSMLMTIDSAYKEFVDKHPDIEISRSKFYELKPPHIILMSETPNDFCLCSYCENFDFLFQALRPYFLINGIENLKNFLQKFRCNDSFECASNKCEECYDYESILDQCLMPYSGQEPVKWIKWIKNGCFLQKEVLPEKNLSDVIVEFSNTFNFYQLHRYLIFTQHAAVSNFKKETDETKAVVQMDFSENFTVFSQNEVQAAHFNRRQISLFTAVATIDKSVNISFAIVNDDLKHSKFQVFYYMQILIQQIKKKYPQLSHVEFVTDGCASQFKNKYILTNLLFTEKDLGITANWHFMPTSHGKSSADGIGGVLKRQVSNRIKTGLFEIHSAADFVTCSRTFTKNIEVILALESEMDTATTFLKKRWANVKTISGTQSFHYYEPLQSSKLLCAISSKRDGSSIHKVLNS